MQSLNWTETSERNVNWVEDRENTSGIFLIWCWNQQYKWVEINNLLPPFLLSLQAFETTISTRISLSLYFSDLQRKPWQRWATKELIFLTWRIISYCCTPRSVCSFCPWDCFLSSLFVFYQRKQFSLSKKQAVLLSAYVQEGSNVLNSPSIDCCMFTQHSAADKDMYWTPFSLTETLHATVCRNVSSTFSFAVLSSLSHFVSKKIYSYLEQRSTPAASAVPFG